MHDRVRPLLLLALLLGACGSHEPATEEEGSHEAQGAPAEDPSEETPDETAEQAEPPAPPLGVESGEPSNAPSGDRLVTPVCAARVTCGCFPGANAPGPHCVVGEATGASGWASHFARGNREELSCFRRCVGDDCIWVCDPSSTCTASCSDTAPAPYHCEENAAGDCVRVDH